MSKLKDFYSTSEHYKRVWDSLPENATVADAMRAMREAGNLGWFDADTDLLEAGREKN